MKKPPKAAGIPRSKADDYLLTLALESDQRWLKLLVASVVATRASLKPAVLDCAFDALLVQHGLKDAATVSAATPLLQSSDVRTAGGFAFSTLTHEGGVNALAKGARLAFHAKLTVIYGQNGSGKSGFVRILKRLAGSKTEEEIWQDVRSSRSKNRCKASIAYMEQGKAATYAWNGESGVDPFRGMGVFDGKCVPVYLTRNLTFSYQPYGFELFQVMSEAYRGLQERLVASISKTRADRPFIDFCNTETPSGKFLASVSARTSLTEIATAVAWSDEDAATLRKAIKERNGLSSLDEQAELLRTRAAKLEAIETALAAVQADMGAPTLKAFGALAAKYALLAKRKVVKKGKTLEDYKILNMESDEWEQFLDAGEQYIELSQHEGYPEKDDACIYCQQQLGTSAHRLLRLYRELYQAEESTALDELKDQIESTIEEIAAASYRAMVPYSRSDYDTLLPASVVISVFGLLTQADKLAGQAKALLRGRKVEPLVALKTTELLTIVVKAKAKVRGEMKALGEARKNLLKRATELDRQILALQDREKLSRARTHVEKFVACEQWAAKASRLTSLLSTKSITDLGKRAWNDLVSDAFQASFIAEGALIGAPPVKLGFRGEYGSQVREKSVEGLTQIDQLLSEGEQKAVALADFFAEQSLQTTKMPMVFDDPATSFDHERKERIAGRIVEESQKRQVIVFTHDLMFASYLFERVQTGSEVDSARALFHDVRSEAATSGVVTDNYYVGAIKFDATMKKVDERVTKLVNVSGEERVDGIRAVYGLLRRAVEKAVEERIFGRVISRWSDQIQMHNVSKASLDREKLDEAKKLHELFSRYIEAHSQSDNMIQHAIPDFDMLRAHIAEVRRIAAR